MSSIQRGFTAVELVIVLAFVGAAGIGITLLVLVCRALLKYIGA